MSCPTQGDNLIDLVYDELDPAAAAELRKHLGQCPACRAELADLKRARRVLQQLYVSEPAEDSIREFARQLVGADADADPAPAVTLVAHGQAPRRQRDWAIGVLTAVAATLIAGLTVLPFLAQTTTPHGQTITRQDAEGGRRGYDHAGARGREGGWETAGGSGGGSGKSGSSAMDDLKTPATQTDGPVVEFRGDTQTAGTLNGNNTIALKTAQTGSGEPFGNATPSPGQPAGGAGGGERVNFLAMGQNVAVPTSAVRGIEAADANGDSYRLHLAGGTTLTGQLAVNYSGGTSFDVVQKKIADVRQTNTGLKAYGNEKRDAADEPILTVVLNNGDKLVGRLAGNDAYAYAQVNGVLPGLGTANRPAGRGEMKAPSTPEPAKVALPSTPAQPAEAAPAGEPMPERPAASPPAQTAGPGETQDEDQSHGQQAFQAKQAETEQQALLSRTKAVEGLNIKLADTDAIVHVPANEVQAVLANGRVLNQALREQAATQADAELRDRARQQRAPTYCLTLKKEQQDKRKVVDPNALRFLRRQLRLADPNQQRQIELLLNALEPPRAAAPPEPAHCE